MSSQDSSNHLISAIRAHSSQLNLLPLQRHDPQITAVIFTAKHTVLYRLDQQDQSWQRDEVEGPFFIVERCSPPYYQIIILNRRSIDNYVHTVKAETLLERQDHYLFFSVAACAADHGSDGPDADEVIGLWFYELPEVEQANNVLNKSQTGHDHDMT